MNSKEARGMDGLEDEGKLKVSPRPGSRAQITGVVDGKVRPRPRRVVLVADAGLAKEREGKGKRKKKQSM
jgi:hypothetical protein